MPSKLNNNLKRLKFFLRDSQRKNCLIILYEVSVLTFINKGFPYYYFGRLVYRKNTGNFRDYLSTKAYFGIIKSKKLNAEAFNKLMDNKLFFSLFCEKNNLPTPKLWSYNFQNSFYYNEKVYSIKNIDDLTAFFSDIFKDSDKNVLFLKPFDSKGGKGIYLLELSKMETQLRDFGDVLLNAFYIHQEPIEQHPDINSIYSKSINTLRIMTFLDSKGQLRFLETCMRFGLGGSYIDNVSSGGFEVSTNMVLGILSNKGYQGLEFGGQVFIKKHPDTEYPFYNFKIPYFNEAHNLCSKLAHQLPKRLTGWDIAITPSGPVIVEANAYPDITIGENHYKGYLKHPTYKLLLSES